MRVTPANPVATVPYRLQHLPLKLLAEPESEEYTAAEGEVPVPVPREFHMILKRAPPDKPKNEQQAEPPGFSPAGSIPAAAPETPAPTFSEESRPVFEHIILLIAFLLLLVGGWLWNALRRRGWLERLPAGGDETEKRLQSDTGEVRAAFHGDLLQLGRELRRRRFVPSAQLDVDRTLAATVERGGLLTPVFGSLVEPEFLVLVDRASLRDHLAQLTDELLQGLCERGLSVERFVYHRDPAHCRHQVLKHGARDLGALDLGQLFARFAERRLILFGDGRDLFDPYTGRPLASVAALLQWQRPILVTPRPAADWGRQEWAIDRAGCALLPLDPSGLKLLGEVVGRDRALARPGSHAADRSRPVYLRDLDRLLDPEPPDKLFSDRVLEALEQDLPQPVFYWLAGCAVYPEIHWGITLRIGARLIPRADELAKSLPQLAQLPWLRHAYLPDWLREALLAQLPATTEDLIRAELDDFLARLRQETRPDASALRIAAGPVAGHTAAGDVWRGLKALLGRQSPVESLPAAEDLVFLRYMSRPSSRLGVRASEALGRLFDLGERATEVLCRLFDLGGRAGCSIAMACRWSA